MLNERKFKIPSFYYNMKFKEKMEKVQKLYEDEL